MIEGGKNEEASFMITQLAKLSVSVCRRDIP